MWGNVHGCWSSTGRTGNPLLFNLGALRRGVAPTIVPEMRTVFYRPPYLNPTLHHIAILFKPDLLPSLSKAQFHAWSSSDNRHFQKATESGRQTHRRRQVSSTPGMRPSRNDLNKHGCQQWAECGSRVVRDAGHNVEMERI